MYQMLKIQQNNCQNSHLALIISLFIMVSIPQIRDNVASSESFEDTLKEKQLLS